ncbi:MAG: DUF4234 domain-containing protein [Sandaracinaceae bacterium]|nr:DUF4234 domain-containing protein [Sandaracinaceae bacterium]
MGYRNETEHLRHWVEQLEGELATLKGSRRLGREDLFAARARRQMILIGVLAALASLAAGGCLVPTGIALFTVHDDPVPLDELVEAPSYATRRFEGTMRYGTEIEGDYYDRLVPLAEDPRVIVSCSWSCPYDVEQDITERSGDARSFYGTVSREGEYDFDRLDPVMLRQYAEARSLDTSELVVVRLEQRDDPRPPLVVMVALTSLSALALWIALFWQRRAARTDVPLPVAGDYQTRDPAMTLILTIATCRLYELVWIFQSTSQLRRLTGRRDLVPGLDVMLTLMTFGLWSFWVFYRNVEAVDEVLEPTGHHMSQMGTVVGLTFGSFVCGILHWVLLYKVQEVYNQLVVEKMSVEDL